MTQFTRRSRRLTPGALMTPEQFYTVARLIRSSEPAREAARLVLVDGLAPSVAARQAGVSPQSVSNSIGRVKRAHAAILQDYKERT